MKINGSLVFDASSASEIQNLRVEKYSSNPSHNQGSDQGRAIFNTTENVLYYGSATAWVPVATGGNAANLQNEVNAIEDSLGTIVNSTGVFQVGTITGQAVTGSETTITQILQHIVDYATSNDTLAQLDDVTLTGLADGDYLRFDLTSGLWKNFAKSGVLADLGLTSTAAELNELHLQGAVAADFAKLHAISTSAAQINNATATTASTTELNYVDGVTSSIQDQLDNKQPLDATLTALAAMTGTGILVETGVDTFTHRTLVAPAAGFTIADPAGVAGNPTFALANDLAALEALATTGYIVRTGDGTAVTRTLTGTTDNIVVTNGSGVASDTSIDLAAVTQGTTGNFKKFAVDGFGRVVSNTNVVLADITALADGTYVNVTGDTMTGNLAFGGNKVTGLGAPSADDDAANKAYVDALTAGLAWKNAVKVASTANGTLASAFAAGQVVDGVTLVLGDRILLKNQTAAAENGIYVVTAGTPTRSTDMDVAAEFSGAAVFVQEGTANADSGWTQQAEVTAVGTTPVTWSQFSGSATYTWGTGLFLTGNTVDVLLGAGISQLPTDEVGIDLRDPVNGAIILTTDGSARSTASGAALHLLLDAAGGLAQTASGLKINAASVANAMLTNSTVSFNTDAGTPDAVALGETLQIIGTSVQGVSTSGPSNNVVQITVADATTASKGVSSFDSGDFSVSAGVVSIKAAGIDNVQLANSVITMTGDTGSDAVALGESFALKGASGSPITTNVVANQVDISIAAATTGALGVASFNAAHFSVTAGAVSLAATLDDLDNVSTADAAATGDLLTKSAGDWVPVTRTAMMGTVVLGDLQDVGSAAPTSGYALVGDGSAWQAKKVFHVETVAVAATSWTVTHGLGVKYCNVTVVDNTDNVVIPQSIVFVSTTELTVTFNTAITGKVVVAGVA